MILADKIIKLRKKNGWSQEELADKMDVSRQAVSKWEVAATIPNLEKIMQLSELFGVTTDYLLKDEIEDEEFSDTDDCRVKRITIEEANAYLDWRNIASVRMAVATFLCIISIIPLLILGAASEVEEYGITENFAGGAGVIALFLIVTIAVAIFIMCGFGNAPYDFIDEEPFELEYGVKGMVKERQKAYRATYSRNKVIGACMCVISPVPIFIGAFTENEFMVVVFLTITIWIAGLGVFLLMISGIRWSSMQKLLKEGDFVYKKKKQDKVKDAVASAYWLIATAIYLGWSFFTMDWGKTWIVWPVAGVLFAAVMALCNIIADRDQKDNL
ncbi:MAG: helix-turn-helix transcriptional regulator [Lachnospiraceae bacterium]|nr:helix-turn-helix transcriptional regulator [Lachnospiraceae bacterium]